MVGMSESTQSDILEVPVSSAAPSRWRSPGAALFSAMIPGLGQLVLNQTGVAAGFFLAAVFWILLYFRPFRVESMFPGWILLFLGGWFLMIAACCHALRTRRGGKNPGSFLWLPVLLPVTLIFPAVSHVVAAHEAGFQDFRIGASSMEPALWTGDNVMADMTFFRHHPVIRGEIVLFRSPISPGYILVKRIIAIGGDTISGKDGQIILNGKVLAEAYAEHTGDPPDDMINFGPIHVPPHKLFVMGDNRDVSLDSRTPEFGLVDDSSLVGKPLYITKTADRRVGKPLS